MWLPQWPWTRAERGGAWRVTTREPTALHAFPAGRRTHQEERPQIHCGPFLRPNGHRASAFAATHKGAARARAGAGAQHKMCRLAQWVHNLVSEGDHERVAGQLGGKG